MAVRAAAARALAPLVAPDVASTAITATLNNLAPRFPNRCSRLILASKGKGSGAPRVGYNASHGALLCVKALLAPGGPAAAADPVSRAAAVDAAAGGLAACVYLASESPVAAVAAEWLACAEAALALTTTTDGGCGAAGGLRRLAWKPSNPSSFGRFVMQSGGGAAAEAAAKAGASVAPADVVWVKTAARLRVKLILAAAGAGSNDVGVGEGDKAAAAAAATTTDDAGAYPARGDRDAATTAAKQCLFALPYEGKAAGMKALRDAGPDVVAGALDIAALLTFLCTVVVPGEKRHSCIRRGRVVASS